MARTIQPAAQSGLGVRLAHDPGDPLITSHCPFCGSGQVVGRSDGTIECGFCGQNYIVRVQPAFPGMPQMPGEGGAPSDIGPDGGVLPPDAIGPDGLPVGGDMDMPPGDGEEEAGAPPFGDADDEEGDGDEGFSGPPGAAGDDEAGPPKGKDDGSKGPPAKGKGKSKPPPPAKKGARRQAHLEYTPHVREVLPLHMLSHHGWTPAEVRSAMAWGDKAMALERHHDGEHAEFGPPMEHRIPHAHSDVSHDLDAAEWKPPPASGSDASWLREHGIEGSRKPQRTYFGLGGEVLTEAQYVRHLAANLSGHDPAVMEALRTEASQ